MFTTNIGCLIGTTNGSEWQHIFTGAFRDCQALKKDYYKRFKELKVIYHFNLDKYRLINR